MKRLGQASPKFNRPAESGLSSCHPCQVKKSPRSTTLQGHELLNSSLVWDENKERLSVPEIVGTRPVCKRQQCSAPDN
jgi:hypothetical protein